MECHFDDNSIKVSEAISAVAEEWLDDATRLVLNQTVRNSRVDTGRTKASWKRVVNGNAGYVGSEMENAIWEEYGTGVHSDNKQGRKTPWYVPVADFKGNHPPTYQGKVVIVHGKGDVDFYKTDGKKPNRALRNAKDSCLETIRNRLKTLCGGKLK
jgi:hypothetical protein